MWSRIPVYLQGTFKPEQLLVLSRAAIAPKAPHLIDYRVSFSILRKKFYLVLLLGRERRNRHRLAAEGQINLAKIAWLYYAVTALMAAGATFVIVIGILLLRAWIDFNFLEQPFSGF